MEIKYPDSFGSGNSRHRYFATGAGLRRFSIFAIDARDGTIVQ